MSLDESPTFLYPRGKLNNWSRDEASLKNQLEVLEQWLCNTALQKPGTREVITSLTSNDYTGVVVEESHVVKSRVSNGVDVRWSLKGLLCSVVKYELIAVDV